MEGKQKILFPLLVLLCACSNNIEEHRVKTHKLHPSNIGVCKYYKSYQTGSTVNHFFSCSRQFQTGIFRTLDKFSLGIFNRVLLGRIMYKMEFFDDDFSDLIVIDNDEIDTYNKTYKLEMRHNYVECYRTYLGDETCKFRTFIKSDSVSNSITTDYETKIGDYLEKIDF